ncbi:MAG: hypothetical protein Q4D71_07090 [Oscillospiraceae bacterium]|nr:hypothetical protein [Oscillospiraceae bacterium]
MDRQEIIERLRAFPYDSSEYWVITGGAMVLYGFRNQTGDIDLGCTKKMADQLEADGWLYKVQDNGRRSFRYGEDIEVFEDWLEDTVQNVEGIPVISVKGLIKMKKSIGREKDLRDIALIEDNLKRKT